MKVLAFVAILACGAFAQEGPKCQAPNGGGLIPVVDEFLTYVPVEQILEIALTAMTSDPEVQSVMEFLSGPEFQGIVGSITNQEAFLSLKSFACSELFVDIDYYLSVVGGILGFPSRRVNPRFAVRTPGINGLLEDILALIPAEKMQELLEQKLNTDYYVQLAFQKINSDEFGILIETLQGNAAYGDMKNRLRALGVDVDGLIESVGKIFRPQA